MAREQSTTLPAELREWVERKAAERDADPETVLARAVAIYRALDAEADDPLGDVEAELETLADRVRAVEDDLDYKIDDVRERVVQVKRESDAKAPRDHDHPDLEARVDEAVRAAADAEAAAGAVDDRLDRGFENYEEILEYLTDLTDDLDGTVETLTSTMVDLRAEVRRVTAAEHDRRAVDDLRTAANRHGERTASCIDCDATVDLGLLSRPNCPHCEATFVDFEPPTGFFGSATLVTGDRPALPDGRDDALDDPTEPGPGGATDD
jgi:chromosome segregation ATPase